MKVRKSSQHSVYSKQGILKNLSTIYCLPSTQKGFTLIEIILIIVLLAIAIPALVWLLGTSTGQSVDAEYRLSAANLAQELMEEIRSKCWDETATASPNCGGAVTPSAIGTDGGESRTACTAATNTFDDVDDYDNYSETNCSWLGATYTRSVKVCYVTGAAINTACPNPISPTDYKRIEVTVSSPNWSGGPVNLITIVTNY